jgi:hypothetical protein
MGFWRGLQDTLSLGGTYRIRIQSTRLELLTEDYEILHRQIAQSNGDLTAAMAELVKGRRASRRMLKTAVMILDPVGDLREISDPDTTDAGSVRAASSTNTSAGGAAEYGNASNVIGAGAGAGGGAAFWAAVQVLGHASTGTAIAGLQGAAAANAGWAWLGGGSLAAGGGGMAVGHLVLPGIGTAIAVAISSTISHKQANKIAVVCENVERVNGINTSALSQVHFSLETVRGLEAILIGENKILADIIVSVKARLFPFGILSRIWRRLRFWVNGTYYRMDEQTLLDMLDRAVVRFLSAMPIN